jgi:hypothetical protein
MISEVSGFVLYYFTACAVFTMARPLTRQRSQLLTQTAAASLYIWRGCSFKGDVLCSWYCTAYLSKFDVRNPSTFEIAGYRRSHMVLYHHRRTSGETYVCADGLSVSSCGFTCSLVNVNTTSAGYSETGWPRMPVCFRISNYGIYFTAKQY